MYEVFTETFTLMAYSLVLLQGAVALISITAIVCLITRRGWKRHFIGYTYELGLLALYGHFLFLGPVAVSPAIGNVIYWAALIGFLPLGIAPLFLEWGELVKLQKKRKLLTPRNKLAATLWLCGILLILTFLLALMLRMHLIRLHEIFLRIQNV